MRRGLWSAGVVGVLCIGAAVWAQDSKPVATTAANAKPAADTSVSGDAGTMAVKANLVVLPTIVRDKKGALVSDLKKDDFSLAGGWTDRRRSGTSTTTRMCR